MQEREHKSKTPIIGITLGDINGIGSEVILKTLSDPRILKLCTPVIYASVKAITKFKKIYNLGKLNFNPAENLQKISLGKINVLDAIDPEIEIQLGQSTEEGGKAAFQSLEKATSDLLSKKINALVTAPINKKNIQNEDFTFPGHTEYFAENAGVENVLMMLISDNLRVGVVTGHIPLKDVSKSITEKLLIDKIKIMHTSLIKDFGIRKPKIAVLGLNPHAGDNGLLGSEENEIIIPALEKLKNENILAFGPYPSDGFFGNYKFKAFDGVMAMYHDQGLIPFKTIAFETGVNFTAGLPFIRTSPDHGTAYEIAGKNKANETSFREALFLAIDVAKSHLED